MSLLPKLTPTQLTQQFFLDHGSLAAKLTPAEVEFIVLLKRKADAHDILAETLKQKYIDDRQRYKEDHEEHEEKEDPNEDEGEDHYFNTLDK